MADEATLSRSLSSLDDDPVFAMHRGGKIDVNPSVDVPDRAALAMAYTPGVARVCSAIADEPELAGDYTWVGNAVAVVSDGAHTGARPGRIVRGPGYSVTDRE